ncbi:MAG: YiiX/YebB-like N1pC/P60 family cysteine hydrolase [Pseudomonadota bacterium]
MVKRPKRGLTKAQTVRLRASAQTFAGKPYDLCFEWSDGRIYCPELVWKMYSRAIGRESGQLQKLREFDLRDPVVAAKMRARYGTRIPLGEPVISPAAIYDSPLLTTIGD